MFVMGGSLGGLKAYSAILTAIERGFGATIALVQHVASDSSGLADLLNQRAKVPVKEAEDKEAIRPGMIYIAPAGYHLLVERDGTFSLSVDEKENHSRPSIDVLFESAADAYGENLVGVLLTGLNADGAAGLAKIHACGGFTIVQDPKTAEADTMPLAGLRAVVPDRILPLEDIGPYLNSLAIIDGKETPP